MPDNIQNSMDKIEFIIPTYNRTELLFTTVCSIISQTNPNWTIHIVGDNIPEPNLDRLKSFLNFINDDRIKLTNLPERYNDWGHTPRNYGVEHATSEWVIMTGEDNYYCPEFVDQMLQQCNGQHFVYCDMVHNWMNKEYIPIKSKLESNLHDMLSGIDDDKIILSLFLSGSGYFGKDNHVFLPIIIAFFFTLLSSMADVLTVPF